MHEVPIFEPDEVERVKKREIIVLPVSATKPTFESFPYYAEKYMRIAYSLGVKEVTFSLGQFNVTVTTKE